MKLNLSSAAAGLVLALALALGACQSGNSGSSGNSGGSALTPDVLAKEFRPLAVTALEHETWYPNMHPHVRNTFTDCLALQTAKVVGPVAEKSARTAQAQARIATYLEQLNQRELRPFDRTCPEIIFKVEEYLPTKRR